MMLKRISYFVLSAGLLLFFGCKEKAKTGIQTMQARSAMEVNGMIANTSVLDQAYSYTGTLLANEEVELRPEISAKVTGINFKEGSTVRKGDKLVKMFDADLQAQLKKNQLQIELAEKELLRKKELFLIKGISQEEFDVSENKLNTLKAERDLLVAQISKTELIAPFSGIVWLRKVSEGAFVSNSTVITTLQQLDPIKVEFAVPEKFLSELAVGKDINFSVESSEDVFNAKIYATESKIDAETRSIKIRAICPNSSMKLFPGHFASIKLNYTPQKETLVIPARAVFPVLKGEQVFVVKDGKASPIDIKTGFRDGMQVEVLQGIVAGDTIVTSGLLQIKEGMPVKVKLVQ